MTNSPIYIFNVDTVRGTRCNRIEIYLCDYWWFLFTYNLHQFVCITFESSGGVVATIILSNLTILECPQNIAQRAFKAASLNFYINGFNVYNASVLTYYHYIISNIVLTLICSYIISDNCLHVNLFSKIDILSPTTLKLHINNPLNSILLILLIMNNFLYSGTHFGLYCIHIHVKEHRKTTLTANWRAFHIVVNGLLFLLQA